VVDDFFRREVETFSSHNAIMEWIATSLNPPWLSTVPARQRDFPI
jgi:hypothetical protein